MARTSARTQARQTARARLAEVVEQRRKRESTELDLVTDFETALGRRDQADADMAAAVASLLALGNDVAATAALTGQTEPEVRRLRKLAEAQPTQPDAADVTGPAQPGEQQLAF